MYKAFFHLRENPFNLTPDPRYLYLSPCHREALDHLLYGIRERKGFIAVTGGIGTGKTTLCRALLGRLDACVKTALIFNSFVSGIELLETINQEFGIPYPGSGRPGAWDETSAGDESGLKKSKKLYVDALNRFLLETFSRGGNAVIIIDEAQNLPPDALEQVRLLSNLETETEKLLQIILVGQTELSEILSSHSLRQLDDRITVRYDLRSLDAKEIESYVEHRLLVAGGQGDIKFARGAFDRIYEYSQGIPRRINAICDRALLIAYARESYHVSKEMIDKAAEEIRGIKAIALPGRGSGKRSALSALLLLLLIGVSALGGWRYKAPISRILAGEQEVKAVKAVETKPPTVTLPVDRELDPESFYLGERDSIAGLFNLYRSARGEKDPSLEGYIALVSLDIDPEYYVMLKRPFRVRVLGESRADRPDRRFLLIRTVSEEGALAVDRDQNERFFSRGFLLEHWGGDVTFVYPNDQVNLNLIKGMRHEEVLRLQQRLQRIGYPADTSGVYDDRTSEEVKRFQRRFGLRDDGIAGPKTRALLYQIAARN